MSPRSTNKERALGGARYLTKTDAVAAALREGILSGVLKPETQLLQEEVAEQLNVSPTPVREAFGILESEGFLERRPHRGVIVREWKPENIEDVYEMRRLVEGFAIRKAAQRATSVDIKLLEAIIAEAKQGAYQGDVQRTQQANLHFHEILMRMSGSQPIADVTGLLLSKSMYYVPRDLSGLLDNSVSHQKIVDALRRHDPEGAARLITRHLDASIKALRHYHRRSRRSPAKDAETSDRTNAVVS